MPFIESFSEFRARMGCPAIYTNDRYLFENGAQSDGHDRGLHSHREPPDDKFSLLSLQAEYLRADLKKWETKFNQLLQYVERQTEYHEWNAGPAPEPEALEELARLKAETKRRRTKLAAAERKLARNSAAQRKSGAWQEKARQGRKETAASIRQRLSELEA